MMSPQEAALKSGSHPLVRLQLSANPQLPQSALLTPCPSLTDLLPES